MTGTATVVDHVRLLRNHPELRWRYRVHEQILPAIRRNGGEVRWTEVVIQHTGYQDPALRRRKLERDLRLLRLEDAEHPDDPFTLFNLGQVYHELGQTAAAVPLWRRSLERSEPGDSIVRKLYALLAQGHRQLGQSREAVAACRAGRVYYPDDIELLFQEGLGRRELRDYHGAEQCLRQLLETQPGEHFGSVNTGLRGYKARHNLAVLYHEQGRGTEAEVQWQAALAERSDFLPAWLGLAEVYLGQQRWDAVEEIAQRLEKESPDSVEAAVLRARSYLARQEFPAARQLLDETIARAPEVVWPRVVLSQVLLQEGRDWAAAEQALRQILAREPSHIEARRNLAILRQQQGRAAETAS